MRVTQKMLFDQDVGNMNTTLTSLMELNIKAQTQKRVNKPSDDPAGMIQILDHRDTLRRLDQYEENISTAKGWLGRSDSTLQQVSTLLTRAKALTEQAATGTVSDDNREQISYEMRSIFEQLIGLANMKYEDKSLYAGQKTDSNAFKEILWVTSNDSTLNSSASFSVEGFNNHTTLVQFVDDTGATATGDSMNLSNANLSVRYSIDGGKTFLTDGNIASNGTGGWRISLPQAGASVTYHQNAPVRINDPDDVTDNTGTWLWVRPTAQYIGDDQSSISVDKFGSGTELINASAEGAFNRNAVIRIDNTTTLGNEIEYSFSLDGGLNWTTGNTLASDGNFSQAVFSIPGGGVMTLSSNGGAGLAAGSQFVVHPRTADMDVSISVSEKIRLNDVGMDIFGGVYQDPDAVLAAGGSRVPLTSSNTGVVFESGSMATTYYADDSENEYTKNLFETMGNLVAFLETNNQHGIQRALENLEESHAHIMNAAANVGGREHQLDVAESIVGSLKLNEKERLSNVEDADVSELMTDLAQQQIVYESVLRSSSMIMQMNLMKFI